MSNVTSPNYFKGCFFFLIFTRMGAVNLSTISHKKLADGFYRKDEDVEQEVRSCLSNCRKLVEEEVMFLVAFECLSVCNRDSWKAFE